MIDRVLYSDLEEVLALQKSAFQSEAEIYGAHNLPPMSETLAEIRDVYRDHLFLKDVRDGHIVGAIRGGEKDGVCHVARLIVHPAYRNKGVGTALLYALEEQFADCRKYVLFTGHRSEKSLYLYQSRGYRETRREKQNDDVTLVFMEKNR